MTVQDHRTPPHVVPQGQPLPVMGTRYPECDDRCLGDGHYIESAGVDHPIEPVLFIDDDDGSQT